MEAPDNYCCAVRQIEGVDTYIFSPASHASLLKDQALAAVFRTSWARGLLQTAEGYDGLYAALGHQKGLAGRPLEWWPVLCWEKADAFYHVAYRASWMCRECGHVLRAPMVMPMSEGDPDFYYGTGNRFPAAPPFFEKRSCPKCGRALQNHWIFLTPRRSVRPGL